MSKNYGNAFLEKIYQILANVFSDGEEGKENSIGIYALSTLEVTGPFGIWLWELGIMCFLVINLDIKKSEAS